MGKFGSKGLDKRIIRNRPRARQLRLPERSMRETMRHNRMRLRESDLRRIVRAMIVENFTPPFGAVGETVKTYLQPMHREELEQYLEAGLGIVFGEDGMYEDFAESDDEREREYAEQIEMELGHEDLVGYEIREVDGLLEVDIHANTEWGLQGFKTVIQNCEEDWGDPKARKAYMSKAIDLLDKTTVEDRMNKHILKPPAPSWGSAMPASKYGRD